LLVRALRLRAGGSEFREPERGAPVIGCLGGPVAAGAVEAVTAWLIDVLALWPSRLVAVTV
jgi:hypothetical protein